MSNNLTTNEKTILSVQVSPAAFTPTMFAFTIAFIFLILSIIHNLKNFGLIELITAILFFSLAIRDGIETLIRILTTEFTITNRRITAKTGFLDKHTLDILLPKIESVSIRQSLLGRIMNFGTITITGTGGTKESFRTINNPLTVKKKIDQIIEHYTQSQFQATK